MTIQGLINKIFRANQTQNNTVSWSGSNGLKSIQEDIVDTIRQRTFFTVPTTTDLTNQGFSNAVLCYVQDNAFYRWEPSGIPNGTTIFPANDGGVWVQETIGDTDGTVTSIGLSMPAAFTVANSPVTTSGVIGVTANGTSAQYIKGDGTLGTLPTPTGGTVTNVSALTINSTGTDLSSTVANPTTTPVITLSVPTASALNRGVLSSADWTTFNSKQNALTFNSPLSNSSNTVSISQANGSTNGYLSSTDWTTFNSKQNTITLTTTGTSGAATLVGATLNIPQYQSVITNPVTGTGTTNYMPKWTSSSALGNSLVYDNGTNIGIGTTTPGAKLDVVGNVQSSGDFLFSAYNRSFASSSYPALNLYSSNIRSTQNIYSAGGTNGLSFYNNGSSLQFRIFDNGNVTVNSATDAGYKLDVNGTARVQGNALISSAYSTPGTTSGNLRVLTTNAQAINVGGSVSLGGNGANPNLNFVVLQSGSETGSGDRGFFSIYTNGTGISSSFTERLRVTSNGTLSINHIKDNIASASPLVVYGSASQSANLTTWFNSSNSTLVYIGSNGLLGTSSSITASSAIARGVYFNNTLVAAANSDVLVGLDITPTFTNGAFTGVSNLGLRVNSGNVSFGGNSTPSQLFVNGGFAGTTPLDIYLANFYGTSTINTGFGTGTKQWILLGRGSLPQTSAIAGINLGNNNFEAGLLFATASGGVFSEKMRIWNTGNVTINSTTDAGYKLDVNGTTRFRSDSVFGIGNGLMILGKNTGGAQSQSMIQFDGANGWNFAITNFASTAYLDLTNDGRFTIGNNIIYTSRDSSAVLNLVATNRGFLQPRMTTTQRDAIATPATGLSIYNTTTNTEDYYNGTTWVSLQTSAAAVKSFGAWQTDATQTAAVNNTGYGVRFDTADISGQGVAIQADSLGNNTLIKMANAGYYNIQFSFQFQNVDNQLHDVSIWLRKNGQNTAADVAGSGGFVSVPNSHGGTPGHCIVAWNYFVQANANDYFQLVWSTNSAANVTMEFYPAGSPPPSSASAILTVNQVN